ncbi:MAG: ATP-binding protein [Desulfuromonadales bacterium]|nr:ATP-binding protein [Desulfuromonadales bacterium]
MRNEIDIQIRVPNQTRYLSLIGNIGENMAREICGPPCDRECLARNLNVVLTEAMANAIRHANSADPDKEIQICIHVTNDVLSIFVYDNGEGFDLNSVPCPSFDSDCLNESGRGIFIIRALMDSVVYRKANGGNVLEMKKTLK